MLGGGQPAVGEVDPAIASDAGEMPRRTHDAHLEESPPFRSGWVPAVLLPILAGHRAVVTNPSQCVREVVFGVYGAKAVR